jgi:hypothetical protein
MITSILGMFEHGLSSEDGPRGRNDPAHIQHLSLRKNKYVYPKLLHYGRCQSFSVPRMMAISLRHL